MKHTVRTGFDKHDPRMVRLHNKRDNTFLHMSGSGDCASDCYAWLGYPYQAENLKQRALTRGEEWPYVKVSRTA